MANERIVDIGLVFNRDRKAAPGEKDQPVDLAMLVNNGEGLRIRLSVWDYEHERILPPLIMGDAPSEDELATLFRAMHDRFQEWNGSVGMARVASDRRERERSARLEAQVRELGGSPVA